MVDRVCEALSVVFLFGMPWWLSLLETYLP
jgi:hypothetical protein